MRIMLIFLGDITYNPLQGPAPKTGPAADWTWPHGAPRPTTFSGRRACREELERPARLPGLHPGRAPADRTTPGEADRVPVLDGDDQHIAGADPVAQIQNDWGEFRNHGRAAVAKRCRVQTPQRDVLRGRLLERRQLHHRGGFPAAVIPMGAATRCGDPWCGMR